MSGFLSYIVSFWPAPRKSIKARTVLLMVTISLLGVAGMAVSGVLLLRQSLIADAQADLAVMATQKSLEIDRFFTDKLGGLSIMTDDVELDVLSRQPQSTSAAEREVLRSFLSRVSRSLDLYDVFAVTSTGYVVETALHEDDLGTNLTRGRLTSSALAVAFNRALTPGAFGGIPTSFYTPSNRHAAFLAAPIHRGDELVGVLAAQINVREDSPFMTFAPGAASSLELVVGTNSDNNVQLLSPLKKRSQVISNVVSDVTYAQPMRRALSGERGTDIDEDYVGDRVLASWIPLERWGLGVVVKVDLSEVTLPARRLARDSAVVVIIVLALILAVSWVVSSTFIRRIRHLEEATSRVADGALDVRVLEEGEDEIASLARSFNDMTARLASTMALKADLEKEIELRVQFEKERNNYVERLKASNRDLEQFAYVASHDLQEPLRMVSSYTQLLERRYADQLDDTAREFIDYAVDGSQRMQRLINDLLQYSRISTRGEEFTDVDLQDVAARAVANARMAPGGEDVLFLVEELPTVHGDAGQLERLVTNLVTNAVKFQSDEKPIVRIQAHDAGKEWVISVEDNGIGIEPQYRERIFLIFQRLHDRENYPGTGLGLAICKRIVQRHGGRIWVDSRIGEGSTFRFALPKTIEGDDE